MLFLDGQMVSLVAMIFELWVSLEMEYLITMYLGLDGYNKLRAATLVVMGLCHLPRVGVYM